MTKASALIDRVKAPSVINKSEHKIKYRLEEIGEPYDGKLSRTVR